MLDLQQGREGVPPRDAATLILLRDHGGSLEIFCVERSKESKFMGGAVVFPGGKLDDADRDPAWAKACTDPRGAADDLSRALAIAACRESLEEAAILPLSGGTLTHEELLALRKRTAEGSETLLAFLTSRGLRLDLARLHLFARWVTPTAESRRFDARFYLAVVPDGVSGAHDEHETTRSFWARPADVIDRFVRGEIQLAPPTHRTLAILAEARDAADAVARAAASCLDPICPKLVAQESTMALVLPGDPEHDVREPRSPGPSRYVLRGDRFLPEDAPGGA